MVAPTLKLKCNESALLKALAATSYYHQASPDHSQTASGGPVFYKILSCKNLLNGIREGLASFPGPPSFLSLAV